MAEITPPTARQVQLSRDELALIDFALTWMIDEDSSPERVIRMKALREALEFVYETPGLHPGNSQNPKAAPLKEERALDVIEKIRNEDW